jgi:DNA helicase IV
VLHVTSPDVDLELAHEQAHLDRAHAELERMRAEATNLVELLNEGAASDFNIAAAQHRLRMYRYALDTGRGALCFGRIDSDPALGDEERWYVGRRHIEDESGDPVVVDWRAKVAVPFYRATYRDPQGLARRRRLTVDDHTVTALFDEDFSDPDSAHRATGIADPLLAELDRGRTGEMRDIVATIAAEQDVVIRAPLRELLVVQGGPGTGKTAIGLHRAALLLYDHRDELERDGGVLVVGPNRLFLRYIAQVLPSLGETAVVQTTLSGLGSIRPEGEDRAEVAVLKSDLRMAELLRRAAWGRVSPPSEDLTARTRWGTVRLAVGEVTGLLELSCAEERTVSGARARFVADAQRRAHRLLLDRRTEGMKVSDAIAQEVRSSTELKKALDKVFPAITGVQLVRKLLSSKAFLATHAAGLLTTDEQRLLLRKSSAPWTVADVPLVDEAEALLGERPRRFGHLVIDEAQDLSAMAFRMLARRSARGLSMTVLGDLAQATLPGSQRSWDDVIAQLGAGEDEVQQAELTTGYRVPGQVLEVANLLLPHTHTTVPATTSVRSTPAGVQIVEASRESLVEAVVAVVESLLEQYPSVAVIASGETAAYMEAIGAAGHAVGESVDTAGDVHVAVLAATEAKGLEFDAVVVVEPADLFDQGAAGTRLLYIAMTRATQELAIVHGGSLPEPLRRHVAHGA